MQRAELVGRVMSQLLTRTWTPLVVVLPVMVANDVTITSIAAVTLEVTEGVQGATIFRGLFSL